MLINEILREHIVPFEIENEKMKKMFSYFLHLAPTIESGLATYLNDGYKEQAWFEFLDKIGISIKKERWHIYKTGPLKDDQLKKYKLSSEDGIERKYTRFICVFKPGEVRKIDCLLRHIRNSLAHGNVFMLGNKKKYIVFDDYNRSKNMTARILFSQTDLNSLMNILKRYTY